MKGAKTKNSAKAHKIPLTKRKVRKRPGYSKKYTEAENNELIDLLRHELSPYKNKVIKKEKRFFHKIKMKFCKNHKERITSGISIKRHLKQLFINVYDPDDERKFTKPSKVFKPGELKKKVENFKENNKINWIKLAKDKENENENVHLNPLSLQRYYMGILQAEQRNKNKQKITLKEEYVPEIYELDSLILCSECKKRIDNVKIFKCEECQQFSFCISCLINHLKVNHSGDTKYFCIDYRPAEEKKGTKDWSFKEEITLLNSVNKMGYGNWEKIRQKLKKKSIDEIKKRCKELYLQG